MKTKHTVIAACIATLFLSGNAFAKDSWNYHEDQWNNVKSYGKVVISQDSVDQWGPWEDFAEPAAGLIAPATLLGFAKGEPYRNNPDVNPTPTPSGCAAGTWCGYAIFVNKMENQCNEGYFSNRIQKSDPWVPALFALTLTPEDSGITAGEGRGPGSISWQLSSLGTTQPVFTDSGGAVNAGFGGGYWFMGDDGLHHFHTDQAFVDANGVSHNAFSNEARQVFGSGPFEQAITGQLVNVGNRRHPHWVWVEADEQVAVGNFSRMTAYLKGERFYSEEESPTQLDRTSGYYVVGIATPQAYLAAQQTNNVQASYIGGSYDGSRQGSVAIQVQFGPGTWRGQWEGSINFQASGNISGANIASTSISALSSRDSASYSGNVQGTFYGQTAGSIGGVSSVTRTPVSIDPRSIAPQTPVTQTAIFLVNKVPTSGVAP